jgi:hypothetical protein
MYEPPASLRGISVSSAYIKALQRSFEAEEPSAELSKKLDLEARLRDWLNSQPEISRQRPYAMSELERALGTQGRYLSPVLFGLGWERRRRWTGKSQYLRYWVPPDI